MARKRKTFTVIVTVTASPELSAADVRREIKDRVSFLRPARDDSPIYVRKVAPAAKIIAAAQQAWEAWGGGPKPKPSRERLPLIDYINGGGNG